MTTSITQSASPNGGISSLFLWQYTVLVLHWRHWNSFGASFDRHLGSHHSSSPRPCMRRSSAGRGPGSTSKVPASSCPGCHSGQRQAPVYNPLIHMVSLYTLIEVIVLILNGLAVLHDERFLAPCTSATTFTSHSQHSSPIFI